MSSEWRRNASTPPPRNAKRQPVWAGARGDYEMGFGYGKDSTPQDSYGLETEPAIPSTGTSHQSERRRRAVDARRARLRGSTAREDSRLCSLEEASVSVPSAADIQLVDVRTAARVL